MVISPTITIGKAISLGVIGNKVDIVARLDVFLRFIPHKKWDNEIILK